MAEFRKLFYAFGLAALLTGGSSIASAQTSTICNSNAGVPPVIRSESYADLVGDYVLDCTGGVPTPTGAAVPQVNFTVTLSTNITSRLLNASGNYAGGIFSEALLLIDEPNRAVTGLLASNPILACDNNNETTSGSNICAITSDGTYTNTYNGTTGHPNVFQGRPGVSQNLNDSNIIVFNGVPFDPPGSQDNGTPNHRYLRFTNIRANAPLVSTSFLLAQVVMQVNVNGSTSVAINNPSQVVASVQRGLQSLTNNGVTADLTDYVQCLASTSSAQSVTFTEGFPSSFKTRSWEVTNNNGTTSGSYIWNGTSSTLTSSALRQNVPAANYNTESGFTADYSFGTPSPNPPAGTGTGTAQGGNSGWSSAGSRLTGAGVATQGTRLYVSFRNIPNGLTVSVPLTVTLTSSTSGLTTGAARLVSTASNGANTSSGLVQATSGTIGSGLLAVYEIAFADPYQVENLTIPVTVAYDTANIASNLPEPFKTAQVSGGFAPYYDDSVAVHTAQSSTLNYPVPRFRNLPFPYTDLFQINKCSCNLLFPFVTNATAPGGNYDTGIAIANTSALPGTTYGFKNSVGQEGAVQFWYYPALSSSAPVTTQCTNTTSPGTCPGTKTVKAGETLTYILSQGSSTWGLDPRAAGFTGYMVAQAQFQYCHAFAYISPQGALPTTNGMSVGYLGLVLDQNKYHTVGGLAPRTTYNGEVLGQ